MGAALVFGGSGFVGTHLTRMLVQSGGYDEVVVADTSSPLHEIAGVRYVHCDVRAPIPAIADDIAEIYNLAAIHTTPGHPAHQYYETNVLGALRITEFAAQRQVPLVVFTSSIAVYGPTETEKMKTRRWSRFPPMDIRRSLRKKFTDRGRYLPLAED